MYTGVSIVVTFWYFRVKFPIVSLRIKKVNFSFTVFKPTTFFKSGLNVLKVAWLVAILLHIEQLPEFTLNFLMWGSAPWLTCKKYSDEVLFFQFYAENNERYGFANIFVGTSDFEIHHGTSLRTFEMLVLNNRAFLGLPSTSLILFNGRFAASNDTRSESMSVRIFWISVSFTGFRPEHKKLDSSMIFYPLRF